MSAKVTIQLPEPLYRRLQGAAQVSHRTVDEVLSATLAVALPPSPNLPETLSNELAEMIWMSDDDLWGATRPTFSEEQQERLAELNDLHDDRPLTEDEVAEQTHLHAAYERSVLRRAQAFAILFRRGHAIPSYADLARAQ